MHAVSRLFILGVCIVFVNACDIVQTTYDFLSLRGEQPHSASVDTGMILERLRSQGIPADSVMLNESSILGVRLGYGYKTNEPSEPRFDSDVQLISAALCDQDFAELWIIYTDEIFIRVESPLLQRYCQGKITADEFQSSTDLLRPLPLP